MPGEDYYVSYPKSIEVVASEYAARQRLSALIIVAVSLQLGAWLFIYRGAFWRLLVER